MWLIWSSSAHLAHTGIHVPKRQRGCRAVAARKAGVDAESAGAVIYEELVGSAAVLTVRRAGERRSPSKDYVDIAVPIDVTARHSHCYSAGVPLREAGASAVGTGAVIYVELIVIVSVGVAVAIARCAIGGMPPHEEDEVEVAIAVNVAQLHRAGEMVG